MMYLRNVEGGTGTNRVPNKDIIRLRVEAVLAVADRKRSKEWRQGEGRNAKEEVGEKK